VVRINRPLDLGCRTRNAEGPFGVEYARLILCDEISEDLQTYLRNLQALTFIAIDIQAEHRDDYRITSEGGAMADSQRRVSGPMSQT
jgi:hypothetical protein